MGRHKISISEKRKRIDISLHPSVIEEIREFSRKTKKSMSKIIEESWRRR